MVRVVRVGLVVRVRCVNRTPMTLVESKIVYILLTVDSSIVRSVKERLVKRYDLNTCRVLFGFRAC